MQLVVGIVALVAGAAAACFLLLYLRTTRRSGEQIRMLTESLQRAGAAHDRLAEVEERARTLGAAAERLPLGVIVKRLRSKLEKDPSQPRCIVTIRGLGYRYGR